MIKIYLLFFLEGGLGQPDQVRAHNTTERMQPVRAVVLRCTRRTATNCCPPTSGPTGLQIYIYTQYNTNNITHFWPFCERKKSDCKIKCFFECRTTPGSKTKLTTPRTAYLSFKLFRVSTPSRDHPKTEKHKPKKLLFI